MDQTAGVEPMELTEASAVLTGDNGMIEDGGGDRDLGSRSTKRAKIEPGPGLELKRVAEIVLVLSTMARMRGGKSPTEAEVDLMAEARAKLAEACAALAPKDVVGREAIGTVIEDLGLNGKVKDQRLGFRAPKLTIKEKVDNAKRKMDESKNFAAHTSTYTSHPVQPSSSTLAENRGTSHTLRSFPSDKPSHPAISSGGISASPLGHASATTTSTSLQYQMPTNEVRPTIMSRGSSSSHLGRDPTSVPLPKVERVQFKLDGGSNGSSYASQLQANSSANQSLVNAPTWSIQTQSASMAKSGQEYKVPNHTYAKVEGTVDVSMSRVAPQAARDQSFRPFTTQTAPGNSPAMHPPLQGMSFVQGPSTGNNHNEVAKLVQKLLQPQRPEHPKWTPPSRDYMNKAITCQTCQITINEVDNVLLCDACEKGYHLKCLQPNQKGIPRGEWHCMRCLALTQGKPLPPKYGRVMRSSTNQPNVTSDMAMKVSSSEKKVGTVDPKFNQQKMAANGSSGLQSPAHTGTAGTNHAESASDVKIPNARETHGNNIASSSAVVDEKPFSEVPPNIPSTVFGAVSVSPSVGAPSVNSSQQIKDCELSAHEERSLEEKTEPPAKSDHPQPLHNSQVVDWTYPLNCAEVPSKYCSDSDLTIKEPESSQIRQTSGHTSGGDTKQSDQFVAQANPSGGLPNFSGASEHSGPPSDGLHGVEWIGNVVHVLDGKSFYQSCRVSGIIYKLQDHALFRSNHGELIPSKLQYMWEDSRTGSKWVIVTRCYFPGDLPENVGRPCSPESNEVYESNHESTIMAGLIQGPCEVLPPVKFSEESERRSKAGMDAKIGLQPVFLCKWFYDQFKGVFQPVPS
ncbi:hypothetical protein I3843_11G190200 [Carya illinoinensis]|uniref:PHD finger protein n=1 Tax=Carya illinoinensis TaxID=32201 RepID=A0A922DS44_CARIL|nr:hypothetical protein I3842_11G192300 [Carya illinoinensis]KAG6689796.1 hypothetical protein I3842_11G192300 [Carya illinoinensis]KAG6689797.1 hypothetical protein I3842_11G192300 [Carya illinoinensis]KAG6689798.1 hypothetical protein I3842_11G192300 [Carya illinoinensis]KAG6689799.1 hypothetical protein I3842_11G192300 [Carya illinoinensis]